MQTENISTAYGASRTFAGLAGRNYFVSRQTIHTLFCCRALFKRGELATQFAKLSVVATARPTVAPYTEPPAYVACLFKIWERCLRYFLRPLGNSERLCLRCEATNPWPTQPLLAEAK
jgi:hypothetical protein